MYHCGMNVNQYYEKYIADNNVLNIWTESSNDGENRNIRHFRSHCCFPPKYLKHYYQLRICRKID